MFDVHNIYIEFTTKSLVFIKTMYIETNFHFNM